MYGKLFFATYFSLKVITFVRYLSYNPVLLCKIVRIKTVWGSRYLFLFWDDVWGAIITLRVVFILFSRLCRTIKFYLFSGLWFAVMQRPHRVQGQPCGLIHVGGICLVICLLVIGRWGLSVSLCIFVTFHCNLQYFYRYQKRFLWSTKYAIVATYTSVGWLNSGYNSRLRLENLQCAKL